MTSTPNTSKNFKIAIFTVIGICVLGIYFFINPTSVSFLPQCPLYSFTGLYCPGCGSQRATHALLHFDFTTMIKQNILFPFGIIAFSYYSLISLVNHFFKKNYVNYLFQTKTLLSILILIILFWFGRNMTVYPFNLLAPH